MHLSILLSISIWIVSYFCYEAGCCAHFSWGLLMHMAEIEAYLQGMYLEMELLEPRVPGILRGMIRKNLSDEV